MKILFLDQSGKLGGAELCLLDIAKQYRDHGLVGLFEDGSFRALLEEQQIPVQVLAKQGIAVRKESGIATALASLKQLLPMVATVAQMSRDYDVLYANTPKALVIGALASLLSHRPLVYHLHDIIAPEHFSSFNRQLIITLANQLASLVIANSHASQAAFTAAGGRADRVQVVYNGFDLASYQNLTDRSLELRQQLNLGDRFIVGHFSRLSPWKGQHILIDALQHCPENVVILLVGDALFGEEQYVQQLHQQVSRLGLQQRVHFLGFRTDIAPLMAACDLVAHTSTAPEPFGRVVVEAMLVGCPVVTVSTGGTLELVEHGRTGWLVPPSVPVRLAEIIRHCYDHPQQVKSMAQQALLKARQRFNLAETNRQIQALLDQVQARQARLAICRELSKTKP